jgi:carboxyl-terminal processing protease
MKRVKIIYIPVLLSIACVIGVYIGAFFNFSSPLSSARLYNQKQKLNTLIQLIDDRYVDEVNTDSIVDLTINEIIKDLDPHTAYLPKAELDAENQSMNGSFVGIGISFYKNKDTLTVIRTITDGPSEKAGIIAGDKILYADGLELSDPKLTSDSVVNILKGQSNTAVNLKVKRKGEKNLLDFKIYRQPVSLKSVDAGFMINDTTGYIKINRFAKTTFNEFMVFASDLKSQNAKRVIVDLRNNGGGYLKEAVDIADQFLENDIPILYTKDRSENMSETLATTDGIFHDEEIIVLINEKSASASEILAGAIQDNDRGVIVGRRSFGKGLVQRIMPLGDGSAIRMTVARYYTPTGRSIQRSYSEGRNDYFNDYMSRYANGELQSADSIDVIDSLAFKTPKGKTVYGGGGIIPDVFVPKNYNLVHIDLYDMFEDGILERFIFDELEKNRQFYNDITRENFEAYFEVSESTLIHFQDYLDAFNIKYDQTREYKSLAKTYLKATIAQQLYDSNLAYKIIISEDEMVKKALVNKANRD